MERDYRPALCAWAALLGLVVGWDVAARATGVPTLSAGAARGVQDARLRWVLWAAGGVLAHHLLVPEGRKLRIRRPRANRSFAERRDLAELPADMSYGGSLTTDATQRVEDYASARDAAAPYLSAPASRRR